MSQDLKETGVKRCFSCIQWTGQRTFYPAKNQIKVDVGSDGVCRVSRQKTKGSGHCDQYFPLR